MVQNKSIYQFWQRVVMRINLHLLLTLLLLLAPSMQWCPYGSFVTPGEVFQVNYSPSSSRIVVASKAQKVYVYNAFSFELVFSYQGPDECNTAKWSKDQKYIAAGFKNSGNVHIINVTTNSSIANISTGSSSIYQVDWSYDYKKLIACGSNGVYIYNTGTWGPVWNDTNTTDSVRNCKFSFSNDYATGDNGGRIRSYTASNSLRFMSRPNSDGITGLDFSPDGQTLITIDKLGKITPFRPITTNTSYTLHLQGKSSTSIAYNHDETLYANGDVDNQTVVWNGSYAQITSKIKTWAGPTDDIFTVDFAYNSRWMATGSKDKSVYVYKRDCLAHCPVEQYPVNQTYCESCYVKMIGCRACNSSTYCSSCTDQFFLDAGSNKCRACRQFITGCQLCTASNQCIRCVNTYYLVSPTVCSLCWAALPGCITCNSSTQCQACSAGSYYLEVSNNSCISCEKIPNCLTCNSSSVCEICQPAYFVGPTFTCVRCPMNCSSCTNNTTCLTCDIGFYYTGTACMACAVGCVTCNPTNCLNCIGGYYLVAPSCVRCVSPCATCSASNVCQACLPGFYMSATGVCSNCVGSCASCTTNTLCLSCNVGYYYLAASNSCPSCNMLTSKCEICTNSTCLLCGEGHYLSAGNLCLTCQSVLPGCLSCNDTACYTCQTDHFLAGTTCSLCTFPCTTCNTTSVCLSCATGYYLQVTTATCQPCPCPVCTSPTNCITCALGTYPSGGSCLSCNTTVTRCLTCLTASVCTMCPIGFYLVSGGSACLPCDISCTTCVGSATNCTNCEIGFYLTIPTCTRCALTCSTCSSSSVCSSCVVGYYLSGTSCLKCSTIFTGCIKCSATACESCQYVQGYYLNGTGCSQCGSALANCITCANVSTCLSCQPSYALTVSWNCSSCSNLIAHCQRCDSSTSCLACEVGFYSSGTSCSACSSGCQSCTSAAVCVKCLTHYLLLPDTTCKACNALMSGCQRCSATNVCSDCGFGYYLAGTSCTACLVSMAGCLECSSSSVCLRCESNYYFNVSSSICHSCVSTLSGCLVCNQSTQCLQCQSNYYLSGSVCLSCTANCQICSDSTQCLTCLSGYYLSSGSCLLCSSLFDSCIFCNSTRCEQCQTGHYVNASTNLCSSCLIVGCQICNNTNSIQCLSCNSRYYLSGGSCFPCSSIANCQTCLSPTTCFACQEGYYISGPNCALCSVPFPNCRRCLATGCSECDNGYLINSTSCTLCANYINGCAYCQNTSYCLNCQMGYYMSAGTCSHCTDIAGCLICRNGQICLQCDNRYYLQGGVCITCSTSMPNCIACSSAGTCLNCQGEYTLTSTGCQMVSGQTFYPYPQLKFTTEYVNATVLKHTLWAKTSQFLQSSLNIQPLSNISYLTAGGTTSYLTILGTEWGSIRSLFFYTNNPFDFSSGSSSIRQMDLFNKRLLVGSNVQIDAIFQLMMASQGVEAILPSANHTGSLYLSYNINEPQFMASLIEIHSHKYYLFGLVIIIYLLIFYVAKVLFVLPTTRDRGQIIPHLLLFKMPALMLFPAFEELYSFCYGFMLLDLPWLNATFSSLLADPISQMPMTYRVFYLSMSLASTYLLACLFIVFLAGVLLSVRYVCSKYEQEVISLGWLIYDFFCAGVVVAGVACLQGAFMNPISEFSANSGFYLAGIVILLIVLAEAIFSLRQNPCNIYKMRVLIKAGCLSAIHMSPVYLFSVVVGFQCFFLMIQLKQNRTSPRLWLAANILPNVGLLFLVELSHSLVSIYVASGCAIITLAIQVVIAYKEYMLITLRQQLKIKNFLSNSSLDHVNPTNFEFHEDPVVANFDLGDNINLKGETFVIEKDLYHKDHESTQSQSQDVLRGSHTRLKHASPETHRQENEAPHTLVFSLDQE